MKLFDQSSGICSQKRENVKNSTELFDICLGSLISFCFLFFFTTLSCFDMYWAEIKVLKAVIKQHNYYVIIYMIELSIQ